MKCKYPWHMYWHGEYTNNGRRKLLPYRISNFDEEVTISCGRCSSCRVNKSREWALKCVAESKLHLQNWFLTLTIDDEHLRDICDNVGDDMLYAPSCHIDDMVKWIKNVREWQRKEYGLTGLKVLYCSEYGDQSERPHYHCCFFGLRLDDLKPWSKSGQNWLYRSEKLEELWKQGQIMVGEVTAESAQYVAKYTMKNTDENKKYYDKFYMERPALRMSRRPGIGMKYLESHMDEIMKDRGIYLNGNLVPIPDSWLEKCKDKYPDLYKRNLDLSVKTSKAIKNQEKHLTNKSALEDRMYGVLNLPDHMHDRDKI